MAKIPWYVAHGCGEVLIIDRDTQAVELHGQAGRCEPARSEVLGCSFTTIDGSVVEVIWDRGQAAGGHR